MLKKMIVTLLVVLALMAAAYFWDRGRNLRLEKERQSMPVVATTAAPWAG